MVVKSFIVGDRVVFSMPIMGGTAGVPKDTHGTVEQIGGECCLVRFDNEPPPDGVRTIRNEFLTKVDEYDRLDQRVPGDRSRCVKCSEVIPYHERANELRGLCGLCAHTMSKEE